jgi:hypothetical protein
VQGEPAAREPGHHLPDQRPRELELGARVAFLAERAAHEAPGVLGPGEDDLGEHGLVELDERHAGGQQEVELLARDAHDVLGQVGRLVSAPLQTRKLRSLPRRTKDTSSLPVIRHQAGKSSSTEISTERNSSSWPRAIGSMCWRIRSRSPLPQSRSPPSKLTSGSNGWRSTGSIAIAQ